MPPAAQVAVRADDPVQVNTLDDLRELGPQGLVLTTHGTAYSEFLGQQTGGELQRLRLSYQVA